MRNNNLETCFHVCSEAAVDSRAHYLIRGQSSEKPRRTCVQFPARGKPVLLQSTCWWGRVGQGDRKGQVLVRSDLGVQFRPYCSLAL